MHLFYIKSCFYFVLLFIFMIIKYQTSHCLSIPDQHLTLGKLFYYKVNLTETQKKDVIKVELNKILDSRIDKLPYWFIFHNFTFIGFPVQSENMKFISIQINFKNQKFSRDVFLINYNDLGNNMIDLNSPSSVVSSINFESSLNKNNFKQDGDCEIQIEKVFEPLDLWNTIIYLMPKSLSESLNDEENTSFNKPDPNIFVNDWARDLFTVSSGELPNGEKGIKLLIRNQACERDLNDLDDVQYKLTKIGIQYTVSKAIKFNLRKSDIDDDEDDEDDEDMFNPQNKEYLNDIQNKNFNINKIKRHLNHNSLIHSTPVWHHDWISVSSSNLITSKLDTKINSLDPSLQITPSLSTNENLFRMMPSFTTPDIQLLNTLANIELFSSELSTPHYPFSVLSKIYKTPSYLPEPPKEFINTDLLTPTPTYTFIISDTANEFSINQQLNNEIEQNTFSILTSPTLSLSPVSTLNLNEILPIYKNNLSLNSKVISNQNQTTSFENNNLNLTNVLTTISPSISSNTLNTILNQNQNQNSTFLNSNDSKSFQFVNQTLTEFNNKSKSRKIDYDKTSLPNRPPIINERIPKLRLTSGVFWRYVIPEDTFTDYESGNTRFLEISFAPKDKHADNIVPADLFIQFDRENQILTAFPTDDNIGRYKFVLTAADSSGLMVSDDLEISVVQHKLSRSFTHKFTLENIIWNSNTPLVEAVYNLIKKIAFLFNNRNVDSIFLQKVEVIKSEIMQNGEDNRVWNITWTNSSLPTYPCPEKEIQKIFNTLAQSSTKLKENTPISPSLILRKTLDPEYQIDFVRYSLSSTCYHPTVNPFLKKPILRNKIKNVTFEIGSVLIFKIPSDTFNSPKQGDTRDLTLELLSHSGFIVDRRDCIGLSHENQTIYGLALTERFISEDKSYRLIARDPDLDTYAHDVFALQILPDKHKNQYNYELTLQFKPNINVDLDLLTKVNIAKKLSNSIFDGDISNLKVLKIKKLKYLPSYKTNFDYQKDNEIENKKRSFESSANQYTINPLSFYEYIISSSSLASSLNCPSEKIQNSIINKLFGLNSESENRFQKLRELFLPDYDLIYVGFRSIGKCKNHISPAFMGSKLVAEHRFSEYDEIFSTTENSFFYTLEPIYPSTATREDDYLLRTIIPVVLLIIIIFLFSCFFIILLIRFIRNYEKNRFDITSNLHGVGEAESFLQKGRVPVILESDLNPNVHLLQQQNYVDMMTPMKQLNRNPYQNLTHEPHRRPPPAYKINQSLNNNT